ncbi:uncharacterized protein LOC117125398 [Anneissia japonica]|uniref:uncharacterized protein LOC117125398 n=1 Tax=Anneissia japonica TaxID=1529436 RepID=UPI001425810A|nr:uncharacterized protein LOC117125398 [Anneissia japonica]
MMRKLTSNILVTFVEVQEEVNFVKKTLATRQDMTSVAYHSIHLLIAELIAALIVHHPDYLSHTIPHEMAEDSNVCCTSRNVELTDFMTVETSRMQNGNPDKHRGNCEQLRAADTEEFKNNLMKQMLSKKSAKNVSMQDDHKSVHIEENFFNVTENARTAEFNDDCNNQFGEKEVNDVENSNSSAVTSIQTCVSKNKPVHVPDINQRKTFLASIMDLWEGECPLNFPVEVITCNRMDALIRRTEHKDKCLLVRQVILDEYSGLSQGT